MMLGSVSNARRITLLASLSALAVFCSACRPWEPDGQSLVVATPWSVQECRRVESQFRDWQAAMPERRGLPIISINWQPVAAGTDITRAARSAVAPDLLLGVSSQWLESLQLTGDLDLMDGEDAETWIVVREAFVPGTTVPTDQTLEAGFADPRNDLATLRWMLGELTSGDFAAGYAKLVRAAGHAQRASRVASGTNPGPTPASIVEHTENNPKGSRWTLWTEGLAIPKAGAHRAQSRLFARFLRERRELREPKKVPSAPESSALLDLTADLLGATLVDAQDELWTAWAALEKAGYPSQAVRWMTEPPPWPAASITRITDRQGESGLAMLETLAAELAPEASTRAWLTLSWISSSRAIDLQTLQDLATADDGHLMAEPRARAWLRAEWSAWARQRYRRVTRWLQAGGRDNLVTEAGHS